MYLFDPAKHEGVDLRPSDFTTQYDATHWYPFFEDENGGFVYAYGHVQKESLVQGVAEYFRHTGTDEFWLSSDDVTHAYAFGYMPKGGSEEDWVFELVPETHPGRFPVSIVSV